MTDPEKLAAELIDCPCKACAVQRDRVATALRAARNEAFEEAVQWHLEQAAGEDALAEAANGPRDTADRRLHVMLRVEHRRAAAAIRSKKDTGNG